MTSRAPGASSLKELLGVVSSPVGKGKEAKLAKVAPVEQRPTR
jgi:hypothetical protein